MAGDVHGDHTGRDRIIDLCGEVRPDLMIICGDVTHFGPPQFVSEFISRTPVRTLAVPGNCDTDAVVDALDRSPWENVHRRIVNIDGWSFMGRGGAGRRSHSAAMQEHFGLEDMLELTRDVGAGRLVLVFHEPAQGYLDSPSSGTRAGSRMLREFVYRVRPALVLSAHIHENPGIVSAGGTLFVNPGPALDGNAALVELDGAGARAELVRG